MEQLIEIMNLMERTEMAIDLKVATSLYKFIKSHPSIRRTLDVGLGEGASAMTIMLATGLKHTAIDSLQFTKAGLTNIARFGFTEQLEMLPGLSSLVLAELRQSSRIFDLSFLDAGGRIDDLFVDFHFVSAMTTIGGFILIPDNDRPTVLKFMNYLQTNRPDFQVLQDHKISRITVVQKLSQEDLRHWGDFHDF